MTIALDTDQIRTWVKEAGSIARRYFGHADPEWKDIADPVTAADREIERFLTARLRDAYPGFGIIGEEYGAAGGSESGQDAEYVWAIDPVDGTRGYVAGLASWCITLALLHDRQPVFGLVYVPLLDDWTYTEGDDVIHNGEVVTGKLMDSWRADSFLVARSDFNALLDITFTRVMSLGSGAVHLATVACGTALAAVTYNTYLWDLAAGAAFLSKQGGAIRLESGETLDFTGRDLTQPVQGLIIGGHPAVTDRLLALIRWRDSARVHPDW